jgi:hypothetical protein
MKLSLTALKKPSFQQEANKKDFILNKIIKAILIINSYLRIGLYTQHVLLN